MLLRELIESDVIDFDKATDPANTPIDRVNKLLQRIGISDYGVIINKPFDSKTYELLIDTYMNKVFTGAMENKILDYVIKIYQKRGEQAKQLPPTTEGTRCWKGYKKKGMKTMFGKRVPNCVKNEGLESDMFGVPNYYGLNDRELEAVDVAIELLQRGDSPNRVMIKLGRSFGIDSLALMTDVLQSAFKYLDDLDAMDWDVDDDGDIDQDDVEIATDPDFEVDVRPTALRPDPEEEPTKPTAPKAKPTGISRQKGADQTGQQSATQSLRKAFEPPVDDLSNYDTFTKDARQGGLPYKVKGSTRYDDPADSYSDQALEYMDDINTEYAQGASVPQIVSKLKSNYGLDHATATGIVRNWEDMTYGNRNINQQDMRNRLKTIRRGQSRKQGKKTFRPKNRDDGFGEFQS